MKCIFCENEFHLPGVNFLCPQCNSYYQRMSDGGEYWVYHAYPEKNIKKNFQSRTIRIQKE